MSKNLRTWVILTIALGIGLAVTGLHLKADPSLTGYEREELQLTVVAGMALCAIAVAVFLFRRRVGPLLEAKEVESSSQGTAHPYATLLVASFVVLFVEVMLIRYCGSQIRIFSFYKNVPLVGCFLGLGLGCWLGAGRSTHALRFLLWLLPLTVFLAQGSLVVESSLGGVAAAGTTEHILGDPLSRPGGPAGELLSQLIMGGFCAATLVSITGLFAMLGRLLGEAFENVPRLRGYTVNILASLAGVVVFIGLSYLETPPWLWFLVGLLPLLWWLTGRAKLVVGVALITLICLAVAPYTGKTVWSRYQKLVGHTITLEPEGGGTPSEAYLVQISDVFYQVAIDLRPEAIARLGRNPYPHYDGVLAGLPPLARVLIVGAGTGNDVAAALRAHAAQVDAVDIDPAIVKMGREHHPEHPYDDPRVRVIVDDARRAFRHLPPGSYDAVVFGLLDSHTQLGISSVRLDNYVFTLESLMSARRLLKPGGYLLVTAATFQEWFRDRFAAILLATCESPVAVKSFGLWTSYRCQAADSAGPRVALTDTRNLPTDDWPFLYLPSRTIPRGYVMVVGFLLLTSLLMLKAGGLNIQGFTPYYGHLFFLGAAFLLMEVVAINRLALLFGTTWIVSAVTIALVLILIVAANLTVLAFGSTPYGLAYGGLIVSLLSGYAVSSSWALGRGTASALLYGLLVLLPVYFAGLVFARSFRVAALAGPAIGANILGSVLGGWSEYLTMTVGIRSMALVALAFYLGSMILLIRARPPQRAA